jgi:hypothetical protein
VRLEQHLHTLERTLHRRGDDPYVEVAELAGPLPVGQDLLQRGQHLLGVGRVVLERAVEDDLQQGPHVGAVVGDEGDSSDDVRPQPRARSPFGSDNLGHVAADPLHHRPRNLRDQVLLAGEVVRDQTRAAQPGPPGDLGERCPRVARLGDDRDRRVDDLAAPCLLRHGSCLHEQILAQPSKSLPWRGSWPKRVRQGSTYSPQLALPGRDL